MDTLDRFRGALIGLAVGDAFGAQLEHSGDPFHAPVALEPPLRFSDDTQLAMYTARGLLLAVEGDVDEDVGRAVSAELIAWHQDPTTLERAPDKSSYAAIERLIAGAGWRDAGDPNASPSVVAVRAAPVGLLFAPDDVMAPAWASTLVTHKNPTAVEAAIFVAWLVGRLVRGAGLDRALVAEGRDWVTELGIGGALADALADALALDASLADRPLQWLPEEEIVPGDGGWHAESAVGLAIVAALRVGRMAAPGPDAFEVGLELAARIRGDSDAVGALTGAFLGAAWGTGAIPAALSEPLEALDVLVGLADALHDEASGLPLGDVHPDGSSEPHASTHRDFRGRPSRRGTDPEWNLQLRAEAFDAAARELLDASAGLADSAAETKWIEEGADVDNEALLQAWKRQHGA